MRCRRQFRRQRRRRRQAASAVTSRGAERSSRVARRSGHVGRSQRRGRCAEWREEERLKLLMLVAFGVHRAGLASAAVAASNPKKINRASKEGPPVSLFQARFQSGSLAVALSKKRTVVWPSWLVKLRVTRRKKKRKQDREKMKMKNSLSLTPVALPLHFFFSLSLFPPIF
jgi:hypothetical protein